MSTNRYDLILGENASPIPRAKLLYISTAKYGGDWHSIPHTHSCTELFFVVGGKGQFEIEGTVHKVSADDMVIVNPNVNHTETSLDATPLEYIVLGVDGLEVSVDAENPEPYSIIRFHGVGSDIQLYLRSILREIEGKSLGYEAVCQSFLDILAIRILRRTALVSSQNFPVIAAKEVALAKRYIETHFKENITLDTLVNVTHVNKFHLAHTFRKEFGISPISYMLSLRIAESKHLLRTTDYSLSYIALASGFSSPSYFSQRFHQTEGMTPAQYRQKAKAENNNLAHLK